ncbi:indolepyruvate oxidoreductase, partial [bacterium]|nr:indolepyruvate oxidoreductase [bacterium]
DGLIAMKGENVAIHRHFLRPGGWIVVNAKAAPAGLDGHPVHVIDADLRALELGNPQSLNLILLGFALARLAAAGDLFCTADQVLGTIERRLADKGKLRDSSLAALRLGMENAAG